jgi:hypothetical protein
MKDLSRRNFFKALVPTVGKTRSTKEHSIVVTLGHLAAFPVYSSTRVNLQNNDFILESLPEGIRLKNQTTNEFVRLTLNSNGLLQAHLNEPWPSTAVLSIFTGEIYNL